MMKKISCSAIDDEPIALLIIRQFCERKGGLELTAFSEPLIGLQEIGRCKPDLVFLDIEMNSTSGLDIAHALPPESCLIFTTAHAQYALNGFELDAVDFLHKPFAYERFEKAVEKALRFIEAKRNKVPENIIIKQEYNNISVTTSDILYIEAMENYTKIFRTSGNYILSRTSLKAIQKMLPKDRFLRTHRSYIVSINKIERFSKREITLKGCSATIPIGRQYAENVYSKLTTRSITT